jgi:hypothetical protein
MPYYQVVLEGYGVNMARDDGGDPIIGFYTTRIVRARDNIEAAKMVKQVILEEWGKEPFLSSNTSALPILNIESIEELPIYRGIFRQLSGYTFYLKE